MFRTISTSPIALQRLEAAPLLAVAVIAYAQIDGNWWLFAALFLAPDLSALCYLLNPVLGSAGYNVAHAAILPGLLVAVGVVAGSSLGLALGLIWLAHIAFDRMVGYGLKYPDAFGNTHLGQKGRSRLAEGMTG